MDKSRSKKTIKNISAGIFVQLATAVLSFVSRRLFVRYLSIDYLGIEGLYSSVLLVLSMAELGLGAVAQFFLFKPVEENDHEKICSLVRYFKKLYTVIAAVIFGMGVALIPFLNIIINSSLEKKYLILYYLLFLINSVVTYLAADKVALIQANLDNRIEKYVTLSTSLLSQVLHIVILAVWHNYTLYVCATILSSVLNVAAINVICRQRYPYLKKAGHSELGVEKHAISENIKSTFLYKIGATIINYTDNILISAIVSTAAVGLYANYLTVVGFVQGITSVISQSFLSSIGNLSVGKDRDQIHFVFKLTLLFYNFVAVYGGISFFFLFNDFITLWLGNAFLLNKPTVFAIAFNFYINTSFSPLWIYREANGLFDKTRYIFMFTAAVNLISSIVLGVRWGVFGILISTAFSRIVTQFWYEPRVLYREVFGCSSKEYFIKQFIYLLIGAVSAGLCFAVNMLMPHGFISIMLRAFMFLVICAAVFCAFARRTDEFSELYGMMRSKLVRP